LKGRPVFIGESDPKLRGCSSRVYPQNAYRNGVMYSSTRPAVMPRHLDLGEVWREPDWRGTWAFDSKTNLISTGSEIWHERHRQARAECIQNAGMMTGERYCRGECGGRAAGYDAARRR